MLISSALTNIRYAVNALRGYDIALPRRIQQLHIADAEQVLLL
jgi:hypothetical protein